MLTMESSSDTSKILEKGPEYLRKQMELESETRGRMSAVERLAASKPKYVKSQQVVNSTQEPVISFGSASVSSTGSSNRSSNRGRNLCNSSKDQGGAQNCSPGQVKRISAKRRPDSLLLYRQKCDLLRSATNDRKHHITRKLQMNKNVPLVEVSVQDYESEGDKEKNTTPEGTEEVCSSHETTSQSEEERRRRRRRKSGEGDDSGTKVTNSLLAVPESKRSGKGVSRSHSDISSRYSKNFADFDAFFMYCGLDGEVIESLGRENFSTHSDDIALNIRSVSLSTSDDGFSRSSGDSDGLLEDALQKKMRQGTSVIERNARIIKWLYSCKNAKETGKRLRDLD